MSKILALYNSGRFDLRVKDNLFTVQLQASAVELESAKNIPGFPIELENKTNAELVKSNAKKPQIMPFRENFSCCRISWRFELFFCNKYEFWIFYSYDLKGSVPSLEKSVKFRLART